MKNFSKHSIANKYPILTKILATSLSLTKGAYHYIDMYSGPGVWEYFGKLYDGSALHALSVLQNSRRIFRMSLIEKDQESFDLLHREILKRNREEKYHWFNLRRGDISDPDIYTRVISPVEFGLIFCDPEKAAFDWTSLIHLAAKFPTYDVLLHFSATNRKRLHVTRGESIPDIHRLISRIHRKNKLLWTMGMFLFPQVHWNFFLFSNRIDSVCNFTKMSSSIGKVILEDVNTCWCRM